MSDPCPVDLGARLTRILDKLGYATPHAAHPGRKADATTAPRADAVPAVLQTRFTQIAELLEQRDAAAALPLSHDARAAFPNVAEAARLHGLALLMLGRAPEARISLQDAVRLAPDEYLARCNFAAALLACGETGAAVDILQQVSHDRPNDPGVHCNLANALRAIGDDFRAREEYLAALEAAPGHTDASLDLAAVELSLGMLDDAERRLRAQLSMQPNPRGFLLLGDILRRRRDFAGAQAAYLQGAQLAPGAAQFPYHAGLMADERCHYAEAAVFYRRALELDPDLHLAEGQLLFALRRLYDWASTASLGARLRGRITRSDSEGDIEPYVFLTEDATPAEQLVCARARAARVVRETQPFLQRQRFEYRPRAYGAPLKVGFVSAGFGTRARVPHPTALLSVAMLEELGRLEGIELHPFATTPDQDSTIRQRLRRAARTFHEVDALPAPDIAQRIHAARIDILVDMDGWCAGAVPEVFALRPAPVQVNWLAYPGTSGAPYMDYLVADRFAIPESSRRFYSESIAWLPRCHQPSDTTRLLFDAPPRASFGLPDDAVVFAAFNNGWKLNAASFARMCAVLREVPGAVLWLVSAGRDADSRLRAVARTHGVDPHRLVFSPALPHLQHLARYRHADLFLDTNPCNARSTASDAIWAGCPVLTRPGATFASRVAGSLNHYLGMPELITRNDDDFVATAVRFGKNRSALVSLREYLETQRDTSGLFDMEVYARDFIALLREMDDRRWRGLQPTLIAPSEPVRAGWGKLDQWAPKINSLP